MKEDSVCGLYVRYAVEKVLNGPNGAIALQEALKASFTNAEVPETATRKSQMELRQA